MIFLFGWTLASSRLIPPNLTISWTREWSSVTCSMEPAWITYSLLSPTLAAVSSLPSTHAATTVVPIPENRSSDPACRAITSFALRIARELAQYNIMLMEEPCPPDNLAVLAEIRSRSPIPISAGERVYTKFGFEELFSRNAVDIAQPDIFHAGGMFESKKIAAMAEARHIPVSFHNPSGPVSNAAILQLAACTPNFLIHEIMLTDGTFRRRISNECVEFEKGFIRIPDRPGLGIEVNESVLSEYPYRPRNLRHYTGHVTDIRPKGDAVCYFKGMENETF